MKEWVPTVYESFELRDVEELRDLAEPNTPKSAAKSEVGSFDLAPFFVRVKELETAGRVLAEFIKDESNWMYVSGNYPLPPKIKKAVEVFENGD